MLGLQRACLSSTAQQSVGAGLCPRWEPLSITSCWVKGWFHHAKGTGVEADCYSFSEQQCPLLPTPLLARFGGSLIPRETVRASKDAELGKET